MKRLCLLAAFSALYAIPASAALCNAVLGSNVTTVTSCDLGPYTFGSFAVLDAGGNGGGPILLTGTVVNVAQQIFTLVFNAQLGSSLPQNLHMTYNVTGANVFGVGISATGTGATSSFQEVVCSSAGVNLTTGVCTSGSPLFSGTALAGQTIPLTAISPQQVSVYSNVSSAANGSLTTFTASFQATPEPLTFVLTGAGLAGLGLLRFRRRKG